MPGRGCPAWSASGWVQLGVSAVGVLRHFLWLPSERHSALLWPGLDWLPQTLCSGGREAGVGCSGGAGGRPGGGGGGRSICGLVSYINWGNFQLLLFQILLVSFLLLLWHSHYTYVINFLVISQSLYICSFIFSLWVFLLFNFRSFYEYTL